VIRLHEPELRGLFVKATEDGQSRFVQRRRSPAGGRLRAPDVNVYACKVNHADGWVVVNECCATYRDAAGAHFTEVMVRRDLASYRKKGPRPTTRLLRDLLVQTRCLKGVLLDIGSGIGALTFELLERGIGKAIDVDASSARLSRGRHRGGGAPRPWRRR
jgi:SAM-dependent methyltransferase